MACVPSTARAEPVAAGPAVAAACDRRVHAAHAAGVLGTDARALRGPRPRAHGTRRLVRADAPLAAQARLIPAVDRRRVDRRGRKRRSGGAGGRGRAHRFWLPHDAAPGAAAAAAVAPLAPHRHATATPPSYSRHPTATPPPSLGQRSHQVRPLRRTRRVGCRPSRVASGPRCRRSGLSG